MYRHNWEDKVFASELRFMKAKLDYEQALLDEVRLSWQCQQFSRLPMCEKRQALILKFSRIDFIKICKTKNSPVR